MISYLSGIVIHKDLKYAVIQTAGGVGYKVSGTIDTISGLHEGNPGTLWIYTAVRENSIDLYGFKDMEALEFFELLLTISGIGPKSALGILSAAPVATIREAVGSGETAYLTKISGIGKKVAEKIVLELKGKVDFKGEAGRSEFGGDIDAIEALKSLGYNHKEAKESLEGIPKEITDTTEKIKFALKALSR
jgi:Holliday junction DNA helicase RuvA